MSAETGYQPEYDIPAGIKEYIDWLHDNPSEAHAQVSPNPEFPSQKPTARGPALHVSGQLRVLHEGTAKLRRALQPINGTGQQRAPGAGAV